VNTRKINQIRIPAEYVGAKKKGEEESCFKLSEKKKVKRERVTFKSRIRGQKERNWKDLLKRTHTSIWR